MLAPVAHAGSPKSDTATPPAPLATGPAPTTGAAHGDGQAKGQATSGGGQTTTSNTNATANANTPSTRGTAKKLAAQPAATTGTSGTSTHGASTSHRSSGRASTRRSTRSSGRGGGHSRARRAARAQTEAAGGHPTTAIGAPAAAAQPRRHAVHKTARRVRAHKRDKPASTITSINQAADRVIEVIPGAILLALAVLCALVLALVARSGWVARRRAAELQRSYSATVQALATAIEAKDHTTGGHIERVRELGLLLARRLTPRDATNQQMAYGFLLHDTGKLSIPDSILRKSGRLTEQEWALMRRHPAEGMRILASIPFLDRALDVVHHHHERWDGGGYPDGLAGVDIPLWARIFAVVDALDAMTAERPYRARRPYAEALEEIRRNAGSQFDPDVVAALEAIEAAEVERLLEPAQVLDRAGAPVPELEPLEAILDAAEAARLHAGDVAPSDGDANGTRSRADTVHAG